MEPIALLGGAYQARSIIANAQRCINYYPEVNRKDSVFPTTHYQRPGLSPLLTLAGQGAVRGLYEASNGNCYAVVGNGVYSISSAWVATLLGTIGTSSATPVSMIDNRTDVLLVDGSATGYTIHLANNAFAVFVDGTGTFQGADKVDYLDTFTLWNMPGTNDFGSTLSNVLTIDPTYVAGKTGYPDNLTTIKVNRHELLLLGKLKTEVWYDAGAAAFPFAELPGAYFEHGTAAKYSVASQDISTYFLGQDLQSKGIVFRIKGYECTRISNHALEWQIRQMLSRGADINDAIGFTWQFDGHVFYVLTFVSGDQTWVFDEATGEWHQWAWTDSNGTLHRFRGQSFAYMHGLSVVGDWENGTLYQLDETAFVDTLPLDVVSPISFIRGFPHVSAGSMSLGLPGFDRASPASGKQVMFKAFMLDLECGNGPLDAQGEPAQVALRWSDDRGKTFQSEQLQTTGKPGEYLTRPQWRGLGIARDRLFEISHNIAGPAALNGAWIDATILES